MRILYAIILLALLSVSTSAQVQMTSGSGAPSGACTSAIVIYFDTDAAVRYNCVAGAWAVASTRVVWRTGAGVPSDSLGKDGDYYVNSSTDPDTLYLRVSGAYVAQGTLFSAAQATALTTASSDIASIVSVNNTQGSSISALGTSVATLNTQVATQVWKPDVIHQQYFNTDYQRVFFAETTTSGIATTAIYTSATIPVATIIYVDAVILARRTTAAGSASISMQATIERGPSGVILLPQAIRITTTGSMGLSVATVTLTLNTTTNTFTINVVGSLSNTIEFNGWVDVTKSV